MARTPNMSDILDRIGSITAAELAVVDGVTAGTRTASKAIVVDADGTIDALDIDALSILGVASTSTAAELNVLAGVTPGTRTVSKAIVVDASGTIDALDVDALALNGVAVDATAAELNLNDNKLAGATIGVGADAGTTVAVTIQFTDAAGADMATPVAVKWYYSSDALGLDPLGTAHDGGTAIGSDGALIETVADVSGLMISEADGDVDLVVTDAGAFSAYLVLVINDALVISDELVHEA